MSYNVALQAGVQAHDLIALDVLTQVLLQSAAAPLKKALLDAKVGELLQAILIAGFYNQYFLL